MDNECRQAFEYMGSSNTLNKENIRVEDFKNLMIY